MADEKMIITIGREHGGLFLAVPFLLLPLLLKLSEEL